MKFIPIKDFEAPVEIQKTNFISGVKQFFSKIVTNKTSKIQEENNANELSIKKSVINPKKSINRLKYVKRLTNDEFMIGN